MGLRKKFGKPVQPNVPDRAFDPSDHEYEEGGWLAGLAIRLGGAALNAIGWLADRLGIRGVGSDDES
ncbi:MAG: hypothetical protein LBM73_03065 [Candidatus Nomurabacteria bacterium]|jgi:hypothetical protein|nr:hypothetical protein [Candidatus Nomurabacteria bacterium]